MSVIYAKTLLRHCLVRVLSAAILLVNSVLRTIMLRYCSSTALRPVPIFVVVICVVTRTTLHALNCTITVTQMGRACGQQLKY
jgi:hypothetical protein